MNLEKAVDHGEQREASLKRDGERAGKTIACLKGWLHPEGDRTLRANPLFSPSLFREASRCSPCPPWLNEVFRMKRSMSLSRSAIWSAGGGTNTALPGRVPPIQFCERRNSPGCLASQRTFSISSSIFLTLLLSISHDMLDVPRFHGALRITDDQALTTRGVIGLLGRRLKE